MIPMKYAILLYWLSSVAFGNEGNNSEDADDIQTLRQEMKILKQTMEQKFLFQEEEITHLNQKLSETKIIDENSPEREKSRQGRLLLHPPVNSSTAENVPKIAFSANTVTDHVNLGVHHTLVFGNAISNVGNCYHHSTGNFIPNVSGVYVFDVQIVLCSPGHELRTELVLEGKVMAAHYTGDSTHCSNGGGMAIFHVNAGDSVWVRVRSSDGGNGIAWESSFSGFLLYPDS